MKLPYINKIIIGCWQLSKGHSEASQTEALKVIESYYQAGFRVFDCADIYTGVEELLGQFIKTHQLGSKDIKVHTKYVPDMASLATLTPEQTEAIIDRSRSRLGLEHLDLVQFHWWHYETGNYLKALGSLQHLKQQGKIKEIGLTNFNAERVFEIVDSGIPIASIQTQYSVIDQRAKMLEPVLQQHDIQLLCYGSVAGGLLSDAYLNRSEPQEPHENRSLTKYLLIVEEMGGWQALQEILDVLKTLANHYNTDVASVATAYCLAQKTVRACIVGARNTRHVPAHVALRDTLQLSAHDIQTIDNARARFKPIPGDVYELERDTTGKHGRIMKYNLSKQSQG
jgi:aryl-alcohol dehydrogenase-like predicted oxidoreductase